MALIKCSECGKKVSEWAVACPSCGNAIEWYELDLENQFKYTANPDTVPEIKCSECGVGVSEQVAMCPNCGYPFENQQEYQGGTE